MNRLSPGTCELVPLEVEIQFRGRGGVKHIANAAVGGSHVRLVGDYPAEFAGTAHGVLVGPEFHSFSGDVSICYGDRLRFNVFITRATYERLHRFQQYV